MRAVLYVRVSTSEQALEGYSVSAQTSILKDYAKTYNYDVIKVYQDAGISGKSISARPAMCELLEDAKQKKFDIVLVWKLSRLSRSLLDLLEVVNIFNQNGIAFQSFSEKFDTSTPIGKMLLQLLGSIAEFERNTIAENVKMGLNERFKQGHSKGSIPFGYVYENKKAIIVPEQAEIIQYVFNKYIELNGNGLFELAEDLNRQGFKTRKGLCWDRTLVKDLLRNPFYAGYVKTGFSSHGKKINNSAKIIKGQHDPIIDEDTFNKAAILIENAKRVGTIRSKENEACLSGLLECPTCGAKLHSYQCYQTPYVKANGETNIYPVYAYRCVNGRMGNRKCKGFQVTYKKIDPYVIDALDIYINSKGYNNTTENITIEQTKNNQLSKIENELKKQKALKDKYFKAFESSKVDDLTPFIDKINLIYSKIKELEDERIDLINNSQPDNSIQVRDLLNKISNFKDVYYNLTNPDKKELIRRIVKKIYITPEKKIKSIELNNNEILNLLP